MGKIVCLCGKSSSGKDTILKELLKRRPSGLREIIPYTTRPIRDGEKDGEAYFFTDEEGFQKLLEAGRIIEHREYHTIAGLWRYFTVDDGQIDLRRGDYIIIGTLEAFRKMREYFGKEKVLPVLIELEDGERLQRALNRERRSEHPAYREMCRRFLADWEDFHEDRIAEAGITRRFVNDDIERCIREIEAYIDGAGKEDGKVQ